MVNKPGKQSSQAAIGRALGLSAPSMTKLKKMGMPVTSAEAALAWRQANLNIAQRKPELPLPGISLAPMTTSEPDAAFDAGAAALHTPAPGADAGVDVAGLPCETATATHTDDLPPQPIEDAPASLPVQQPLTNLVCDLAVMPAHPAGAQPTTEAPDKPHPPEPPKPSAFDEARTRREVADANLSELKEAELRGTVIRADAMRSAWATKVATVRDAILQIPSRLAPVLAAESDLVVVTAKLETELRQALSELSTTK